MVSRFIFILVLSISVLSCKRDCNDDYYFDYTSFDFELASRDSFRSSSTILLSIKPQFNITQVVKNQGIDTNLMYASIIGGCRIRQFYYPNQPLQSIKISSNKSYNANVGQNLTSIIKYGSGDNSTARLIDDINNQPENLFYIKLNEAPAMADTFQLFILLVDNQGIEFRDTISNILISP